MAVDAMLESKVTYIKHDPDASTPGKSVPAIAQRLAVSCIMNNLLTSLVTNDGGFWRVER